MLTQPARFIREGALQLKNLRQKFFDEQRHVGGFELDQLDQEQINRSGRVRRDCTMARAADRTRSA